MPAFIRTKGDEARWAKAKAAANKTHSEVDGDRYWGLVNHIYQKMNKVDFASGLVEKLNKITGDEDEQENDVQDYGETPEDAEDLESMGIHEFDPYEEGNDEADAWLRDNEKKAEGKNVEQPEAEAASPEEEKVSKPKSKSGYSEWQPREDYSDEENKAIKEHMDQGYSHREAERMAGAHKGPKNFQEALTHTTKPSKMSDKMHQELKDIAGHWLERADRQSKMTADPEKNPMKFASGQLMQAHENASKDYNKAYNEFLESDKVKGTKGIDRHKAVQAWKQQWKGEHPEYHKNLGEASGAQKHFKEANETYGKNIHDKLMHIITGGMGTDPSSQMSTEEAAQHVGGAKEDEGHQANIIKDPSASFAEANKPFIEHARGQQATYTRGPKTRLQSVQEQLQSKPAAPKVDLEAAKKIILRRANPEQAERFHRTSSARGALGVNKPKGDE